MLACTNDDWKNRSETAWILATSTFDELRDGPLAIEIAMKAAKLSDFKDAGTLDTLAAAYAETGDFGVAATWEQKSVDLEPKQARFQVRLKSYRNKATNIVRNAWTLATSTDPKVRNGKRALEIALEATKLSDHKDAMSLDVLAAAYAETGDFDAAVSWEQKAIELAEPSNEESFRKRLEAYKNRERWWVTPSSPQ